MGLDGSTCSECLPERTCHFQPPEHVPRTSAGAQTCVLGPGGLHVCRGAENTRNDPRPEEKKMPKGDKNTFLYIYVYIITRGALPGCHRSHTQMSHKLSQMMPRHTIENPKYIRYETPDLRRPISITAVSQTAPLLGPKYNTSRTNITNAR